MRGTNQYTKYRSQRTEVDGIVFDSKKEAREYLKLKQAEKDGAISGLKTQVKFELQPSFRKNGKLYLSINYVADFVFKRSSDGAVVVIDVKGYKTDVYKLKKKLFEYKYPEYELTEI